MSDPVAMLEGAIRQAMRQAIGDAARDPQSSDDPTGAAAGAAPVLTPARDSKFGDFQCNAAMALAKSLGAQPRELAARIKASLDVLAADLIEPVDIAGPGFINIRLRPEALAAALENIDTPALGVEPTGLGVEPTGLGVEPTGLGVEPAPPSERETVVVDLCGVNLAKQMHVGHLRATVIGDALARLHERLGCRVIRQNHFGDWGLPIAMVTLAVQRGVERGELLLADLTLEDLERAYRRAQRVCDADERGLAAARRFGLGPKVLAELEAHVSGAQEELSAAKAALVALQAHDPALLDVWRVISRVTLQACFDICRRLGAKVDDSATAGESSYADELAPVVGDLVARGVAQESEGALVVTLDDRGIKEPCLIRKRDGGFLYATTDLAAIRRRVQTLGADRVIYTVDARQALHFKQVFAVAHKAGYTKRPDGPHAGAPALLFHAAFGMVLGEDNRPFKTRSGENVRLADLLDEAVARAEAQVLAKNPDLPEEERRQVARAVAASAIKYIDLSSDRVKDYVFSFDRMLAFEGNTGPYLMYAYVRVRSIFRKAREQLGIDESMFERAGGTGGRTPPPFMVREPQEKAVALQLLRYPAAVHGSAEACEPHRLCVYLYDLAGAFSTFFAACPVLQAQDDSTRLARLRLARLTGRVLRDGLETLGLVALERM